jgi:hypothetical protein
MLPKHLRKTILRLLGISFTAVAFSQKKSNPKIGKNETDVSSFILADNYLAFGGQVVYRWSVSRDLKIGGGGLYGANLEDTYESDFYGYGAVFADVMQFLGHREKWSFDGQLGHGIYNNYYGLKAGIYYSISCIYRAIVSKKMLLATSLVIGERNFHSEYGRLAEGSPGFMGLRFGVVF